MRSDPFEALPAGVAPADSSSDFAFNHLGVAVANISHALRFYENAFRFVQLTEVYCDPVQQVSVTFIGPLQDFSDRRAKAFVLELIEPAGTTSHLHRLLKTDVSAYHMCYAVADIDESLRHLASQKCLKVRGPEAAVAYHGKPIAWCYTPTRHLLELVQV